MIVTKCIYVILLHLTSLNASTYNLTYIANAAGIYYERLGEVELVHSKWTHLITLNVTHYLDMMTNLGVHENEIGNVCNRIAFPSKNPEYCKEIVRKLNVPFQQLRAKHAFLNEVMLLLSGTEEEVIYGTDRNYAHNSTMPSMAMNVRLHEKLTELDRQLKVVQMNAQIVINGTITRQEFIDSLHNYVADFQMLLQMNVYAEQQNLHEIFLVARQGFIHPYVATSSKIMEQLPKKKNVKFASGDSWWKSVTISITYKNRLLHYYVDVPVVAPSTYDLVKMTALPIRLDRNRNVFGFIQPSKPYLLIDKNRSEHFLADAAYMRGCTTRHLCPQPTKLFAVGRHACEAYLYSAPETIPEICNQRYLPLNRSIFIELADRSAWIFVVPQHELFKINCNRTESYHTLKLHATGIIRLGHGCRGRTNALHLHGTNIAANGFAPNHIRMSLDGVDDDAMGLMELDNKIGFYIDDDLRLAASSYDALDLHARRVTFDANEVSYKYHMHHFGIIYTCFTITLLAMTFLYCRLRKH